MQHLVAVRADRPKISDRVHLIVASNACEVLQVVNFDEVLANARIMLPKVEITHGARPSPVVETLRTRRSTALEPVYLDCARRAFLIRLRLRRQLNGTAQGSAAMLSPQLVDRSAVSLRQGGTRTLEAVPVDVRHVTLEDLDGKAFVQLCEVVDDKSRIRH